MLLKLLHNELIYTGYCFSKKNNSIFPVKSELVCSADLECQFVTQHYVNS